MPTKEKNKDSFYFSHDSNARNDIKIVKLRRKLGMAGYGIYWCIIEILREEADHKMKLTDLDDIAFNLGVDIETIGDIIKSFGLFSIMGEYFQSDSLVRRMEIYNQTKTKLSEAGKKGMQNRWQQNQQPTAAPLKRIS
jgi:hypothetical protein